MSDSRTGMGTENPLPTSQTSLAAAVEQAAAAPLGWLDARSRDAVHAQFSRLQYGRISIVDAGETLPLGHAAGRTDLHAAIHVHHPRAYRELALGGVIGAAESYMRGEWSCPRLVDLVRIIVLNLDVWSRLDSGWARVSRPLHKLFHWLHQNTRSGSKLNIAAHYDLGNEFFKLFLDPTLMYSSGVFTSPECSMEEASIAKNDRICRKLDLKPSDHLLEIGAGWGGFAIHAAGRYGCRVTTTTISQQQYKIAVERIAAAGLSDRVTVLLHDYRDLTGQFDKLVSIEMIEAVGHKFFDTYFRTVSRLLKPDGMACIQAITMNDQLYDQYILGCDFIQRYIFPGGCLPAVSAVLQSVKRVTDMRLYHADDITPHYARTLALWREAFFENIDAIRSLGYPETFLRMWDFYLCYCEGAFHERSIGSVQWLFTKPHCRREPVLM